MLTVAFRPQGLWTMFCCELAFSKSWQERLNTSLQECQDGEMDLNKIKKSGFVVTQRKGQCLDLSSNRQNHG